MAYEPNKLCPLYYAGPMVQVFKIEHMDLDENAELEICSDYNGFEITDIDKCEVNNNVDEENGIDLTFLNI